MATSEVEICNGALIHLGARTIAALTDNSQEARLCNARYVAARDYVTRDHKWNCALRRASLPALSAAPEWGPTKQFTLPTDPWCLRVFEVYGLDLEDWRVEGRRLLCDESAIKILYAARLTDPQQIDPMLEEAIALKLAQMIAYALTGSRASEEAMEARYRECKRIAKSADGQEGAPPEIAATWFDDIRHGGSQS